MQAVHGSSFPAALKNSHPATPTWSHEEGAWGARKIEIPSSKTNMVTLGGRIGGRGGYGSC